VEVSTTTVHESIKGVSKVRPIYECRCDERLQTKVKEFLVYTGLFGGLESHIHWVVRGTGTPKDRDEIYKDIYYESRKRELKIRLMNEGRCDERLKVRVEESTYTGFRCLLFIINR
jgi:hypothetical protein